MGSRSGSWRWGVSRSGKAARRKWRVLDAEGRMFAGIALPGPEIQRLMRETGFQSNTHQWWALSP
jgi:hypothetical protein